MNEKLEKDPAPKKLPALPVVIALAYTILVQFVAVVSCYVDKIDFPGWGLLSIYVISGSSLYLAWTYISGNKKMKSSYEEYLQAYEEYSKSYDAYLKALKECADYEQDGRSGSSGQSGQFGSGGYAGLSGSSGESGNFK